MTFNEYQNFCLETADVYRNATLTGYGSHPNSMQGRIMRKMYVTGKLNGEAGELAEKVFKEFRDGVMENKYPEHRQSICKELGDCMWYIAAIADEYGFSLEEVVQANIEKLRARRQKGTLQGSGDDR